MKKPNNVKEKENKSVSIPYTVKIILQKSEINSYN